MLKVQLQKPSLATCVSKANDPRLWESIRCWDTLDDIDALLDSAQVAILGIPDDLGILRNSGKAGAKDAPQKVREKFYMLTPGFHARLEQLKIVDLGDVIISTETDEAERIAQTHERVTAVVKLIVAKGVVPIIIGGGHDFAFPDMLGFTQAYPEQGQFGLINIDAHFDVRDLSVGISSGTPFYRLLELEQQPVKGEHFVEFGIQEHHNSLAHYNYLMEKSATVITLQECFSVGVEQSFADALKRVSANTVAASLTVDIDASSVSFAPGASASYPNGFSAHDMEQMAYMAGKHSHIQMMDILEVSPTLDHADQTSALAASMMFCFLKGFKQR